MSTAAQVVGGVVVGGVVVGGVVVGSAVAAGAVVGAGLGGSSSTRSAGGCRAQRRRSSSPRGTPGQDPSSCPSWPRPSHRMQPRAPPPSSRGEPPARPSLRRPYRRTVGSMTEHRTREHRVEHDSMGEVRVPAWAKWGAQTQRAVENFPISRPAHRAVADPGPGHHQGRGGRGERPPEGRSPPTSPTAIHEAAAEVAAGAWDDHFPVDVFQTGSGTSSNMNVNEVLATLASERLGRRGAPQRPRQRLAVVERRVPVGHPPGRHPEHHRSS